MPQWLGTIVELYQWIFSRILPKPTANVHPTTVRKPTKTHLKTNWLLPHEIASFMPNCRAKLPARNQLGCRRWQSAFEFINLNVVHFTAFSCAQGRHPDSGRASDTLLFRLPLNAIKWSAKREMKMREARKKSEMLCFMDAIRLCWANSPIAQRSQSLTDEQMNNWCCDNECDIMQKFSNWIEMCRCEMYGTFIRSGEQLNESFAEKLTCSNPVNNINFSLCPRWPFKLSFKHYRYCGVAGQDKMTTRRYFHVDGSWKERHVITCNRKGEGSGNALLRCSTWVLFDVRLQHTSRLWEDCSFRNGYCGCEDLKGFWGIFETRILSPLLLCASLCFGLLAAKPTHLKSSFHMRLPSRPHVPIRRVRLILQWLLWRNAGMRKLCKTLVQPFAYFIISKQRMVACVSRLGCRMRQVICRRWWPVEDSTTICDSFIHFLLFGNNIFMFNATTYDVPMLTADPVGCENNRNGGSLTGIIHSFTD